MEETFCDICRKELYSNYSLRRHKARDKKNYEEDEYSLDISKDKIQILHKNYGGKLYGLITLIQLIDFYKNKLFLFAKVT